MRHFLNFKKLGILMAWVVVLTGCSKSQEDGANVQPIAMTEKSLQLVKAGNDFSFTLLHTVLDGTAENRMISPWSISSALSMVMNGAAGSTLTEMKQTLGLGILTLEEINANYQQLTNALRKADSHVTLNLANSIWIRQDFPVTASFVAVNQNYYEAAVTRLPFDNAALNSINKWVSDQTSGKIPTILSTISPNEIMFLINAIYFNGQWKYQFDPAKTVAESFTCSDKKVVAAPMMKMETELGYVVYPDFKALRLPYGAGKFEMVFLLPKEGVSPDKIALSLNSDNWKTLQSELTVKTKVPIWIPKFKFAWEKILNDPLIEMGMKQAFDPKGSDFTAINATQRLYLTRVIHKSYIDVNEAGTEAAAVTAVGVGVTSMPIDPPSFYLVRPFLFFIQEEDTGAILFAGKVENPLNSAS
ncbi:MAG: serpin family protein [Marinilabiliales bacterium]|nr:serpin family protein [Marinilabiliales bacterium]